jgi:hypothetical protein
MRAISLWQPWASAVANGVKKIETRHWHTWYTGPIAIHAAQRRTGEMAAIFDGLLVDHPEIMKAFVDCAEDDFKLLPFGAVVATATLVECVRTEALRSVPLTESALGNYANGRFGWILKDVKKLPEPIPCIGRQRFFTVNI